MSLPHPSLIGVPTETLDKICKMLDYKEILRLRPVCKRLKNYVDIYRPDFQHRVIFVNVIPNGYTVNFGLDWMEFYSEKNMKKITSVDGDEQMWRPLETLLTHQKTQLKVFQLRCESEKNAGVFVGMLDRIQNILASQNRQFRTKSFKTYAQNEDQVMMVLPYLDPDSLESIRLFMEKPMKLVKVKECEQWRKASEFLADALIGFSNIEDFGHFVLLQIKIDTLKMSEVIFLKEKFCDYPIKNFVSIGYRNLVEDAEVPEGHVPIPEPIDHPGYHFKKYMYPIPNTDKNLQLRFETNFVHIGTCPPRSGPLILGANFVYN